MNRILAAILVMGLASTWSSVSFAQTEVVQTPEKTEYEKVTKIDFDVASQVRGNLTRPEVTFVDAPARAKFASMVKIRGNFASELERSADNL